MTAIPRARLVAAALIATIMLIVSSWQLSGMHSPIGRHPAGPADCVIRDSSPRTPSCP
jgi:hypothetical protein